MFATERVGEMPPRAPGALGLRIADGAARHPRAQPGYFGHHSGQRRPGAFTVRVKSSIAPPLSLARVSKRMPMLISLPPSPCE